MQQIYSKTPGKAWVEVCKLVVQRGEEVRDEGLVLKEVINLFISVENPSIEDEILVKYGDKDEKEWMRRLWLETKPIPALGRFPALEISYGKRLFDVDGKNHIEKIIYIGLLISLTILLIQNLQLFPRFILEKSKRRMYPV